MTKLYGHTEVGRMAAERDRLKALNAELLAALKSIDKHVNNAFDDQGYFYPGVSEETGSKAFKDVVRAIAKAEGETDGQAANESDS